MARLDLCATKVCSLRFLSACPSIRHLGLAFCRELGCNEIREHVQNSAHLSGRLQYLNLAGIPSLCPGGFTLVCRYPKLAYLNIWPDQLAKPFRVYTISGIRWQHPSPGLQNTVYYGSTASLQAWADALRY